MTNNDDMPLYIISVAAELVCMHPQTLRLYEKKLLIKPKRLGGKRLYSQRDIETLKFIQKLTQKLKIDLTDLAMISQLQNELEELKMMLERLNNQD